MANLFQCRGQGADGKERVAKGKTEVEKLRRWELKRTGQAEGPDPPSKIIKNPVGAEKSA
jgi:hypothetical protein